MHYECRLIALSKVVTQKGNITAINEKQGVPFELNRMHFLYDVPWGEIHGEHGHKELY